MGLMGHKVNGWPDNVYGPSAIAYNDKHAMPKEMTVADIERFKSAWVDGVKRALKAGFDV
jgi:2,4-dienoyl-CoA reductase-like NADH-dependent reductase (Old Yellow Enzyme family)